MSVQKNLQLENEQWHRNTHILELITYGQLQIVMGQSSRNVKTMLDGCYTILTTIGPLFTEEKMVERNRNGNIEKIKVENRGVTTERFKVYFYNLSVANNHVVAAGNTDYDRRTRYQASQDAYNIVLATAFQLLQEVNAMGFNSKHKNPGYNAGISGN